MHATRYVDIISHNMESEEAAMRPELKPWRIFEMMSDAELEDVRRDMEAVAPAGTHPQFWDDMLVLCDDHANMLSMQREIADMGGLRGSLAAQKSVKDEAEAFLREKSSSDLLQLKATIESKLKDSGSHDTEFMEEV
jgi:hypothetical protein